MVRCGCQDSCTCLIQAGEGVEVEGIGTIERPYVIGTNLSDLTGRILFNDTSTVDFSTVGTGTLSSPFQVSAQATQALTSLSDVSTTAPIDGEIPVWRVDHWEWEPQASNSAQPSGEWGVAPLHQSGADPGVGRVTYLDGVNQLRVQPDWFQPDPAYSATTTFAPDYPFGISLMYLNTAQSAAGGWPGQGSVLTMRRTDSQIQQLWMGGNNDLVKYRSGDLTTWRAWQNVLSGDTGWLNLTVTGVGFTVPSPYISPQARRIGNHVIFRGRLVNAAFSGGYTTIATMPAGITLPLYSSVWPIAANTGAQRAMQVLTGGDVQHYSSAGSAAHIDFATMDYYTD